MPLIDPATGEAYIQSWDEIAELRAENERLQEAKRHALALADAKGKENVALRAALKPFADVGQPFIAAAASGAFPAGASARFMKLEPLTAQQFIDAARALEQKPDVQ